MSFWLSQNGNYCSKYNICKVIPKKVTYRDYKKFDRDKFKREVETRINENCNVPGEYNFLGKTFLLAEAVGRRCSIKKMF